MHVTKRIVCVVGLEQSFVSLGLVEFGAVVGVSDGDARGDSCLEHRGGASTGVGASSTGGGVVPAPGSMDGERDCSGHAAMS